MRALAAAVACMTLLVGCIGTVDDPAAPVQPAPPDGSTVGLIYGLTECRFLNWYVSVSAEALTPLLPDGFVAAPAAFVPGAPASPYLGFESFVCEAGHWLDDEALGSIGYASYFTGVSVPDAYANEPDDAGHYVKWDVLIDDDAKRAAMAAMGIPARSGTAAVEGGVVPGSMTARYTIDGVGEATFTGVPGDTRTNDDVGGFAEFTDTPDGIVVWNARAIDATTSFGTGQYTIAQGSWPAEVIGSTSGTAPFITGTWTFTDGTIRPPTGS